jgi:hypothetical protein
MRKTLLLAFALAGCLDEILIPEEKCGVPCAVFDDLVLVNQDALAITCRPGTSICSEEDEVSCPDYIEPLDYELCGEYKDDDCDPSTTEDQISIPENDRRNDCARTQKGLCRDAPKICVDGQLMCDPNFVKAEVCDRYLADEDCDGLVNDQDENMVLFSPPFKYEGDLVTANVGVCRAGVIRCVDGYEKYEGMILPVAEVCGNRLDDDCDGLVDEASDDADPRAFLLVLDYSGSMSSYIASVEEALCNWSRSRPNDYFGIAGFGISGNGPEYRQISAFVSAQDACSDILSFDYFDGGNEYAAYSTIRFLTTNQWPADDRNVIIFTDEDLQNYNAEDVSVLVQDCTAENYSVGVYTILESENTFVSLTEGCAGWVDYLSTYPSAMVSSLTIRFAGECE